MSSTRRISWTAATRDMRADRAALPAGFLTARATVEMLVRTHRPLVVAGKYDRAAIMAHASAAAKAHQLRMGCTWGDAMSLGLKAAWQVAKTAHRAAAH
ncbi:hypothetical protein [Methylobacterium flocculans]|uniref:hypothetical protein n=1 Tax=Methylobacterium flocculans TaxID=2984843 RepID=UPI0021F3B31B|nr:hypothetical protein [Methylobacterium sp. FF17]